MKMGREKETEMGNTWREERKEGRKTCIKLKLKRDEIRMGRHMEVRMR